MTFLVSDDFKSAEKIIEEYFWDLAGFGLIRRYSTKWKIKIPTK